MTQLRQQEKKNPITAFLPVVGLLAIIAVGIIAWALSSPLMEWAIDQSPNFTGDELDNLNENFSNLPFEVDLMQFFFGAFIFLVGISVMAMAVAMAKPAKKSDRDSTEKKLKAERDAVLQEKKRQKKRRDQMNRQARSSSDK